MQYEELEKALQIEIEKAEEIAIEYIQESVNYYPYIYFGENNIKKFKADSLDEAIDMATEEIEGKASPLKPNCLILNKLSSGSFEVA